MKIVCRSNSHLKSTRVWNLQHEEMSVRELSEDRGEQFPPCPSPTMSYFRSTFPRKSSTSKPAYGL